MTDSDTFELFDLRVTVEEIRGRCTCDHVVGDWFEVHGGKLSLPPGRSFCLYALQSTLPLLPAKQRALQANDWMSTDAHVVCPDPLCGTLMRIERTIRHVLHHADVSAVPLESRAAQAASKDEGAGNDSEARKRRSGARSAAGQGRANR
jgi:uncharacterized repeat protein (TIGR04076 family)